MSEYNIHGLPQDMINRYQYSGLIPQHQNAVLKNIIGTRKVFLAGTMNESTWRERLIERLKIRYFNPEVPDWNEEAFQRELEEKEVQTEMKASGSFIHGGEQCFLMFKYQVCCNA